MNTRGLGRLAPARVHTQRAPQRFSSCETQDASGSRRAAMLLMGAISVNGKRFGEVFFVQATDT